MRNWMPLLSVASAMAPPRASISLTRWLLPMPPMAGLQLMTEGFHVMGQQQGFHTHACRGQRSLGTGMAAADDDHFKTGREIHHAPRACFYE
jgi:hypothetical protein